MDQKKGQGHDNLAYSHGDNTTIQGKVTNDPNTNKNKEEEIQDDEERQTWSNPVEFLLSCIAMSVGIGNFYRFPFVAYTNGGGAFLIPYLIVLFCIGKPMYFLELAVGQFCSYGQVKVWNVAPILRGVGYGSTLASFMVNTYYVSVMALTVFYFFASFSSTLPWTVCDPEWVTSKNCSAVGNVSLPEQYYENHVLQLRSNIEDGIGTPSWQLSLCYLFSWVATFLSIWKGVQSSGKVAYFTAIFPYLVLLLLLITGVMKDGAGDGMMYFIRPQWDKILEAKVWYAAVSQCFFSLSVGFGPIIMYGSYNPFRHNVYRDAMIVSLIDTFTSFFAGLTVFAILGGLAKELGVDIQDVAKSGPGLVFVSYADAIGKFQYVPQLFSLLFFLMLFSLGVGTAVSWQLAVITVICDEFPRLNKFWVTLVSCIVSFLLGLVYMTPGGQHIFTLVDNFSGNFVIYILATLEVMALIWLYGLRNVVLDMEFMLGVRLGPYWKFCWAFFAPVFLLVVLVYSIVTMETLEYGGVPLPGKALAAGWTLAALCLLFVPGTALYEIFWKNRDQEETRDLPWFQKITFALHPNKEWGPKSVKEREEWIAFKESKEL